MRHSTDHAAASAPTVGPSARAWVVTMAAGLAAAVVTWAAGESLLIDETGRGSRGQAPITAAVYSARNGMICLGILGGSLGLAMGLAGGFLRGSARSAGLAGLIGAVLGAAAGVGAARGFVPLYFRYYAGGGLGLPLLVHGGLWISISLAAGLAFGFGVGGPGRVGAIGGAILAVVGALLATLTYEFASVWLFPAEQTDRPIPLSPGSRMFADLIVALGIGAALAFGSTRRQRSSATTEAPTGS